MSHGLPVEVTKGYVSARAGDLHYRHARPTGAAAAKPLLLLQLTPRASEQFEPALPLLAARGYDCWALDLMGYGRSDKRVGAWSVQDFAVSVHEALTNLNLEPEYLVSGHFSTLVALELVIEHRRSMRRLVLDGTPAWTPEERTAKRLSHGVPPYAEPAAFSTDGTHMREFWNFAWGFMGRQDPDFKVEPTNDYHLRRLVITLLESQFPPTAAAAMYEYDPIPRLAQLDLPVLAVTSLTDSLRDCHPRVLSVLKQGVGHEFTDVHPLYRIGRPEQAERYVDLLDSFFRP